MDPVPDLIHFKIVKVPGMEPTNSWLVVRHADAYTNEAVIFSSKKLKTKKKIVSY